VKLYKILNVVGDRGISVFPPAEQVLPTVTESAGEPLSELIRKIVQKGYTYEEAYHALQAWSYHAKHDLHQFAAGVRFYCEYCVRELPLKIPTIPPEPVLWGVVLLVAVIAAVALALYVWAVLGQELNIRFGTHDWAYLMSYQERFWSGEILNVGHMQEGVYEQGFLFRDPVVRHTRGEPGMPRRDWIWFKPGDVTLEGRRPILYHVYRVSGFYLFFCGVMSKFGHKTYKLRKGGNDPFKPTGPWMRPGEMMDMPDYRGCWVPWWWF